MGSTLPAASIADVMETFPAIISSLAAVFREMDLVDGGIDVPSVIDKVRRLAPSGNSEMYLPTEFSGSKLPGVIKDFGLIYDQDFLGSGKDCVWELQNNLDAAPLPPQLQNMVPSQCCLKFLQHALQHMVVSSEAIARNMIDNMLLDVISGMHAAMPGLPRLRLSAAVSLQFAHEPKRKLWSGRLDYALGVDRTSIEAHSW